MLSEITIIYYIYIYLLLENTEEFIDRIDDYVNIATGAGTVSSSSSLAAGTLVNSIGSRPSLFLIFLSAPLSNRKIIID